MRAEFPAHPVLASNVIVLDVVARRGAPEPNRKLGWKTCLSAWVGLSAASWAAVVVVASHFI